MKKLVTILALTTLALAISGTASALVLTFDDITDLVGVHFIPDGYGAMDWENIYVVHEEYYPGTGYDNGVVSPHYVAFNGLGDPGSILVSAGDGFPAFDFEGAYITGAWNNGLEVTVAGYYEGGLVHTETVIVDTTGPVWFDGGGSYSSIDELHFTSSGGTAAQQGLSGTQFAMDNFTYTPIPEPTTMLMLGCVGVGLACARKVGRKR